MVPKFGWLVILVPNGVVGFVDANILGVCEFTAPKAGLADALKPPKVGVDPVLPPKAPACFSVVPKLGVEGAPKILGVSCFVGPNATLPEGNDEAVVTGFAPKPPPNPPKA